MCTAIATAPGCLDTPVASEGRPSPPSQGTPDVCCAPAPLLCIRAASGCCCCCCCRCCPCSRIHTRVSMSYTAASCVGHEGERGKRGASRDAGWMSDPVGSWRMPTRTFHSYCLTYRVIRHQPVQARRPSGPMQRPRASSCQRLWPGSAHLGFRQPPGPRAAQQVVVHQLVVHLRGGYRAGTLQKQGVQCRKTRGCMLGSGLECLRRVQHNNWGVRTRDASATGSLSCAG